MIIYNVSKEKNFVKINSNETYLIPEGYYILGVSNVTCFMKILHARGKIAYKVFKGKFLWFRFTYVDTKRINFRVCWRFFILNKWYHLPITYKYFLIPGYWNEMYLMYIWQIFKSTIIIFIYEMLLWWRWMTYLFDFQ